MAVSFTQGNDFIVPTEDGQTYLGGAGNDTYMLSDATISAGSTIVIQDTEGTNNIQLVGGLSIESSLVTSNALQLTLSNGAVVQILGADSFGYDVGGNALAGTSGTYQTFTELVETTLGATVPAAGEDPVNGDDVTITDGGTPTPGDFTLTQSASSVEEGGTVTYTITATEAVAADTTFNWAVQGEGSNPASPADFPAGGNAGSVVLDAGQSSTTFTVAVANDALVEFNEGFIVTATGAGVVLTDTASITDVSVDNAAPVATAPSATSYAEKSAAGVTLVTVAATDNVGVTDFTISSGNPDGYFQIDAEGNISLTDAGAASALNDFNTLPNNVTLGVKAIDAAGNESSEVTVALTEADVTAPELDSTTRTATTITMSFTDQSDMAALDPSIASAFSVLKSDTTAVTVGSVTIDGKNVILGLNSALDDADLATVVYTKPAVNGLADTAGNAVDSFTKTSIAKDITAPVVADQTFSYIESTPETPKTTTDVIAKVVSADADIDTFTITEGNGNGYFAIDDQGNITLTTLGLAASSTANDFEAVPNSFSLKVTATDNAENVSTAATIGLTVTDDITDNLAAPIIASLTTGADPQAGVVLGSNNDDIISGLVSNLAAETTFSSADFINTGDNGSEGDTLNIELRGASYTGGATIQNVENLKVTTDTVQNFNTLGMSSVSKIINNSSAAALTVQNMHKDMMAIDLNNIAGGVSAGVYQYATGELTGAEVATVTLLSNVGTSNAFSALTIGPAVPVVNSLGEINIDSKAGNGFITLTTDNTQTSLKTINVSGANALSLALAADQIATTATTINAASNSGGFTLTGLGAATHTITGGSGNDLFAFGLNLDVTDTINGGVGTDTLSANGAQLAAVTAASHPTVSNIETLMIADDVATAVTTIDASLFGGLVTNARVVDQGAVDAAAVTFDNMTAVTGAGLSNNIRFDGDLGATAGSYTFNIQNAQDAGTANAVTLDMRGGATTATSTVVLNGVETLTIDTTNGTGAKTFNLTDASLSSLTVKGGQNVDLSGAQLSGSLSTLDASDMVGAAGLTATLNAAATVGAAVTTAGGADTIVGSSLNDTISTGGGIDNITGLGGADKLNGGAGNDVFWYTAAGQTETLTSGTGSTSTATMDILTVNSGDTINLAGALGAEANDMDTLSTLQVAGNLSTTVVDGANAAGLDQLNRVIGVYDDAASTFTVGATGANAVMLSWNNSAAADTVTDESIVLVGITDVASVTDGIVTV